MKTRMRLTPLLALTCAVAACTKTPEVETIPGLTPDAAAVRPQVEAAMQRYNRFSRAGLPDSAAAMFTADGELYEPREAVHKGRSAIRSFFAPIGSGVRIESALTTTQALEVYGKTVLQWGEYVENAGPIAQASTSYRGRFVAEWARQPDGHWLLHRLLQQPLTNR
jgi:ketosteroid isomerase-like protein